MSPIIADAKTIKAKALSLRDQGRFEEAVTLLREAGNVLDKELKTEQQDRVGRRPEPYELDLALQLTHIRGSLGGVFRRQGVRATTAGDRQPFLRESITAYDAGYDIERVYRSQNDSYTLVQRLVARVMLEPGTADAEAIVVGVPVRSGLQIAARLIHEQTQPGGVREKDEYAFGDLAIVLLLLGENDWRAGMQRFRGMPNADYAINGTREVIVDIRTVATAPAAASGRFVAELDEALKILA